MSAFEALYQEIVMGDVYGLNWIKPGQVSLVFDFGANVGVFASHAAYRLKVPVFAFEPFHPQYYRLEVAAQNESLINPVNRGITKDGRVVYKETWADSVQDRITDKENSGQQYQTIALQHFTSVKGALFKIDIEGTEMEMMDDILKLTKHNYVSIELHHQGREVDQFLKLTKNTVVQNGDGIVVARCRPSL